MRGIVLISTFSKQQNDARDILKTQAKNLAVSFNLYKQDPFDKKFKKNEV